MLRERFGLSARDVHHALPAWEVELLLAVARQDERPADAAAAPPRSAGGQPDPWQSPPDIAI